MSSYNFYKQKWTEKSFTYIQYRTENSKSIKSTNISSKKVFPSKYSKTLDTKAIKKKTERKIIHNLADPKESCHQLCYFP